MRLKVSLSMSVPTLSVQVSGARSQLMYVEVLDYITQV